jgi:hypothetical protein
MKFYDAHQDQKDRFAVFAFHSDDVKSFEELDKRLPPIREKHWGGRDLPFPILLDGSGETMKAWGIQGFPTYILIDPEGRIVRGGGVKRLEEELAKER